MTPVYCYTDYPSGELFVNGKSQGKITKDPTSRLDRYRLRWNNVIYEPGEIKVIVYDADGNAAGEQILKTAGAPSALKLSAWTELTGHMGTDPCVSSAGHMGTDPCVSSVADYTGSVPVCPLNALAFITVSLTDSEGTLIPQADDQLTFEVSGAGTFEAVCNGDATSLESFKAPTMKLFNGQLVVIVRSAQEPGILTLKVTDAQRGLSNTIDIKVE